MQAKIPVRTPAVGPNNEIRTPRSPATESAPSVSRLIFTDHPLQGHTWHPRLAPSMHPSSFWLRIAEKEPLRCALQSCLGQRQASRHLVGFQTHPFPATCSQSVSQATATRSHHSIINWSTINEKCSERDLNPHGLRHTPLKRTCLPIPPSELWESAETSTQNHWCKLYFLSSEEISSP